MHQAKHAPLYSALMSWRKQKPVSFHVPGHKNGAVFSSHWRADELYKDILSIDATELTGLDDLHEANGPIRQSERLTADLYKSVESRFLVGGSTAGNLAMIMAVCSEGDLVFVQKNCHKSVLNGLRLSKARPIFLSPSIETESQVATGITVDLLQRAITRFPEVKAIVLTSPNYYGMTRNLGEIVSLAHHFGIPVLVDEAHGAHFVNDHYFPKSALEHGADVVVHSAHKTLPAMTMGSYMHIGNERFRKSINDYLQIFQSSSPSYPIMASLDLARHYLSSFTDKQLKQIVDEINRFRQQLSDIAGLQVIGGKSEAYDGIDPLKVTIQMRGLSGYKLAEMLEEEAIYSELADPLNVLLVCPLANNSEAFEQTADALKRIAGKMNGRQIGRRLLNVVDDEEITYPAYSFAELETMNRVRLPIEESAGLIVGKAVIPYPPGIPVVMPGERLSFEKTRLLQTVLQGGGHLQGMNEDMIEIAIEEE
ncbi:MAG: aminotransferase class I/II-fold pyridoxal phosphate-dependent enzyme [Anaerobacillus sp.]